jgi:hypothetical protein
MRVQRIFDALSHQNTLVVVEQKVICSWATSLHALHSRQCTGWCSTSSGATQTAKVTVQSMPLNGNPALDFTVTL